MKQIEHLRIMLLLLSACWQVVKGGVSMNKIGVMNFQPMLICTENATLTLDQILKQNEKNQEYDFSGYDIEIIKRICSKAGLNFSEVQIKCYSNASDLFDAVSSNSINYAIGGIAIDYQKWKSGFKYSLPLYTGGLKIAVISKEDKTIWRFFYPFNWYLWLVIFFTAIFVSIVTWVFEDTTTFRCQKEQNLDNNHNSFYQTDKSIRQIQSLPNHENQFKSQLMNNIALGNNHNNNNNLILPQVHAITQSIQLGNSNQLVGSLQNQSPSIIQMRSPSGALYGPEAASGHLQLGHPSEEFNKDEITNMKKNNSISNRANSISNNNSNNNKSHPFANYREMVWQSFSSLFFASSIRLQTFSARVIFLGFWFIVVVLSVTYVSNLTTIISTLAVQTKLPTYNDIIQQIDHVSVYTFEGYISTYKLSQFSQVQDKNIHAYPKTKDGLKELIDTFLNQNNYEDSNFYNVLVLDAPIVYYIHSTYPCSTAVILETLNNYNYGIMSFDSNLITSINALLYDFIDDPYWLNLIAIYLNSTPQEHFCFNQKKHIDPPKLYGLWLIFAGAIALSLIIHKISSFLKNKKKKRILLAQSQQQQQAAFLLQQGNLQSNNNNNSVFSPIATNNLNSSNMNGSMLKKNDTKPTVNFNMSNNSQVNRLLKKDFLNQNNTQINSNNITNSIVQSNFPSNIVNAPSNGDTNINNNTNNGNVQDDISDVDSDSDFLMVSDYIHIPSTDVHLLAQEEIQQQISFIETIIKNRFNNVEENIVNVFKKISLNKKIQKSLFELDDINKQSVMLQ